MFGHGVGITDWWCGPGAFFSGPLGMIGTLLFWGLIIALATWFLQSIFRGNRSNNSTAADKSGLNILKERYARGEIGKDEFNRMKTDLI
ncbi:MAG: SHOCT domain-containing protein [Thermodesulfobacteriota bacterium]